MGKAPPAFQFFAADFAEGTDDMTLPEVGGYIRLLCSQWAKGSVPGDNAQKLAGIMRCTPNTARNIWAAISGKFQRGPDDLWRNDRLERERVKQAKFRDLQSQRGKASAEARLALGSTEPITKPQPSHQPDGQPEGNPKPQGNSSVFGLQSSNKIQSSDPTTSSPSDAHRSSPSSPLILSSIAVEKARRSFTFFGSRLRVPHVLHEEFRTKLGGAEPHQRLMAWYELVNTEVETESLPIVDVFEFLRPRFKSWASEHAADADLERFRPKEA